MLSLIYGKEMILKNEVKDFLTKDFAVKGFDETIIFAISCVFIYAILVGAPLTQTA